MQPNLQPLSQHYIRMQRRNENDCAHGISRKRHAKMGATTYITVKGHLFSPYGGFIGKGKEGTRILR